MAETGGTYLPPVIASLVGTYGDLAETLVEAKAALEEFAHTETTAHVGVDVTPTSALVPQLAAIKAMVVSNLAEASGIPLHFTDVAEMFGEKAVVDAVLKANFSEAGLIPLRFDTDVIDAEWREVTVPLLTGMIASAGSQVGAAGGAKAGSSFWGAFLGAIPGGRASGLAQLISALGFGKGFTIPFTGISMAAFGSLAGLAGFGTERALTLMIGLVGSLAQAIGGLGVIAAGTFATMAVGMGSDMLVMRSTIADTQTLYKTLTNLERATLQYGAGSAQADFYTKQLQVDMAMLGNTAGVQAELGLAKLAMTINQQWDQATSNARVQAVGLLTQILYLAQTYIPLVADAAQRNLAIINTALMPLFAWLKGPMGVGIFTDLENKFAKDLPVAVDAFTQGIEFLLRFLDLASNYTGGFIQWLDRLFTYLNSPSGWARVKKDVNDVIAVFAVWKHFLGLLFSDIALLLGQSVGVGTTMIGMLSGILQKLHDYLTSTSGKSAVGSLFQAHKNEIIAIIELLPKLAGPVAGIYIALAVPMTNIATAIANILNFLLNIPSAGPVIAYGIAFAFLASKLQLVAVWGAITGIMYGIAGAIEIASLIASGATVQFGLLAVSLDGVAIGEYAIIAPILLIVAVIAILVVAIVLLITHWKEVTKVVQQVWKDVTKWVSQLVADIGKFFSDLGTKVEKAWSEFAQRPGYWIGYLIGFIAASLIRMGQNFDSWFGSIIGKIAAWGANMAAQAPGALAQFLEAVVAEMNKLPGQIEQVGVSIVTGLWKGIQSMGHWLRAQLDGFLQGLVAGALHGLQSSSPSQVFARIGETIPQGVGLGIHRQSATALTALASMFSQMNARSQTLARAGSLTMSPAFAGAGTGRGPLSIHMPVTVQVSGATAATPQGIGSAVQQAIAKEFDTLVRQLQGGVYANPGG